MCGLAGFLQVYPEPEADMWRQVLAMARTLAHRGPDDESLWVEGASGIALGFRRLAILDTSPAGRQPMLSGDGRYAIVFNGEIYNYRELRRELGDTVRFRGTSDTEVVLEMVARHGMERVLARLWGMFAIALWDRAERTLLLARDRLGKKPLYYGRFGGTFLFGSELKALRAHPRFRAEIDRPSLTQYMRFGYVPSPDSIYQGVRKLAPGTYALVRAGQDPELRTYWSSRDAVSEALRNRLDISDEDAVQQLETLLKDAVARRMVSDVPLGALLSGGIDSSAVVSLMQAQSPMPVRTFTIGFNVQSYNEAEQAKAVAAHLGTDHTELYVSPGEAEAVIPRLPELYDEPFSDSSQIPTFLVCKLARQHVTVALSGDGGDELFGGYTRYLLAERLWGLLRHAPRWVRGAAAGAIRSVPPGRWHRWYNAAVPLIPGRWRQTLPGDKAFKLAELLGVAGKDELYLRLVSQWREPELVVEGGRERAGVLRDASVLRDFPEFADRMMLLDLVTYLPDDILVKIDRASMGAGLEARCPLLDHRVVEWVWRLPARLKVRGGESKWVLRQLLSRHVPRSLTDRPKMGFGIPIDLWLRGPLREWAEDLLSERRLRVEGFLSPSLVRAEWSAHISGERNNQFRLWAVLMFQAWLAKSGSSDRGGGYQSL
jgi:asparagine synthase (glutamine-hydrolysing)